MLIAIGLYLLAMLVLLGVVWRRAGERAKQTDELARRRRGE